MKKFAFELSTKRRDYVAKYFSNISQAVLLFSLSVLFVPDILNLKRDFPQEKVWASLTFGLAFFMLGAIIITRKNK